MNGEELFLKLSKRDFSGSDADEYAQLLETMFSWAAVSDDLDLFYKKLEEAEKAGKRLTFKEPKDILYSGIAVEDFILS